MNYEYVAAVSGTEALLTANPDLPKGTSGLASLSVTFDEQWDGYARSALFARNGEILFDIPLDDSGKIPLPPFLDDSDFAVYLLFRGVKGEDTLCTNDVCLGKLCETVGDAAYELYGGPYSVSQNGVLPVKGSLMNDDLTVNVLGTDTSGDTVHADVLFDGYTAHDASGNRITGTYVNPYNANTAEDTVTADTLLSGVTAHDASGAPITGTYLPPASSSDGINAVTSAVGILPDIPDDTVISVCAIYAPDAIVSAVGVLTE